MKKIHLLAGALAASIVAVGVLVLAGVGSASSTGRTLEFVSVQQRFVTDPADPTLGGRLVFDDVAYNRVAQFGRPAGARIGRAEAVCTVTSNASPIGAQCIFTAHVPDGQLVLMGDGNPGKRVSRWAVVGGLGAYTTARGTVTVTALSQTKSLVVVHLS